MGDNDETKTIIFISCSEKQHKEKIDNNANSYKNGNVFYEYFQQKSLFFDSIKNDIIDLTFYAYEDYDKSYYFMVLKFK